MLWLINDFDLLATLLHAATLALEALLVGGVLFLLAVALPAHALAGATNACLRGIRIIASSLVLSLTLSFLLATVILVGTARLPWLDAMAAGPLLAQIVAAVCASIVSLLASIPSTTRRPAARVALLSSAVGISGCLVALSHAGAQLQQRALLLSLTAMHHAGTAAWIGAMPFIIVTLRRTADPSTARRLLRRYSAMALLGAAALVIAGVGLAWVYIGTAPALYGTPYGVMVLVKVCLLGILLLLGTANWYAIRVADRAPGTLLARIRRFAEVEFSLGVLVILVAASLTSQPPARDVSTGRLAWPDIVARLRWETPRLKSPPVQSLTPPTSLAQALQERQFNATADSDANDRAWSEYNHHWAGIVVLLAGALALASRRLRWARLWPLTFALLALFIVLRADPENWPLGPRPFWASFFAPDVLEHRAAALLILLFAASEALVQAGVLRTAWARFAFPAMCLAGAALLFIHTHMTSTGRDELLAEISHSGLALCGAIAGSGRWLELRLPPEDHRTRRWAAFLWPVALICAGILLLDYREF